MEIQIVISTPGTGLKGMTEFLFLHPKSLNLEWIDLNPGKGTAPVPMGTITVLQMCPT